MAISKSYVELPEGNSNKTPLFLSFCCYWISMVNYEWSSSLHLHYQKTLRHKNIIPGSRCSWNSQTKQRKRGGEREREYVYVCDCVCIYIYTQIYTLWVCIITFGISLRLSLTSTLPRHCRPRKRYQWKETITSLYSFMKPEDGSLDRPPKW